MGIRVSVIRCEVSGKMFTRIPTKRRFLLALTVLFWGRLGAQVFSTDDLKIHGFLTQAYAFSDNYQIFGIPKGGTSDYRSLALQFHYAGTGKISFTLQLAHFRYGEHPSEVYRDPVEIDWAFMQYRISDNMYLRFGKVLMPVGIYNEVRDVGVVLPFYRPPYTPYSEGQYCSETFNGALFYYAANLGSLGTFSIDLFGGGWNWLEWYQIQNPIDGSLSVITGRPNLNNGVGLQVWFSPPAEGLRLGYSFSQADIAGGLAYGSEQNLFGVGPQVQAAHALSFDGDFERWILKGEYARMAYRVFRMNAYGYYLQGGYAVLPDSWLFLQYQEMKYSDLPNPATGDLVSTYFLKDFASGLKWQANANLALKAELHWSYSKEAQGIYVDLFDDELPFTRYFILSLSNSF